MIRFLPFQRPKVQDASCSTSTWLDDHLNKFSLKPEDVQRTLAELTAVSIANDVGNEVPGELLVCGGGAHNPLLMQRLAELLPDWTVVTTAERGVDIDNMEAMAFAWLAYRTLHQLPGNLPEVTGANQLTCLGAIYPA